MSKYHDHRDDCPFKFATLDVCDCVEKNMLDRIEQLVAINEALTAKLATCEKYRDAYAECDSVGTQAVRDLEAKLAECEARLGKADVHPEVSTYWSDYEEYYAMAEIEGEKT